jgi:hypothetical protein
MHVGNNDNETRIPSMLFKEGGRFLLYSIFAVLVAELMRLDASSDKSEIKFTEFSYVEYMQSLLLLVSSTICFGFYLSKKSKVFKFIFLLIFGLSSTALIREQDFFFDQLLGRKIWPYPVYMVLLFVGYKTYKGRIEALQQLTRFMTTKSYAFLTFSIITVFIFSRLYGRSVFWEAVMEEKYIRSVKNASEECIELYGYLFLLFGVLELVILVRENFKILEKTQTRS